MIEIVIHGRGGGGGVTLAKLIAGAYFLKGQYVQAFGVYGAERSGAPVQAFVRVDAADIRQIGPVTSPDHVIVIDPSLIDAEKASGMKAGGWVVINSPEEPAMYLKDFPGCRVATVAASEIAVANRLGSATLPIVNTAMLGGIARLLDLDFAEAEAALEAAGLGGSNVEAARAAFERIRVHDAEGSIGPRAVPPAILPLGFLDAAAGSLPAIHTGEWASRRPSSRTLAAACGQACPAGNDVRGFLEAAARHDYDAALMKILDTSPFPGVCGRVCAAHCMTRCNRAALDEAVNVREVERAVAATASWPAAVRPERVEKVAVVGAGPAGLSAAYHVARAGFPVTVFEATSESGGLLRSGIPAYRLPRSVLDREIDHIRRQGVDVRTNHPVDRRELDRLSRDFAAVVVATGREVTESLDLGGPRAAGVVQGLDFLDAARRGAASLAGQSVAVVGGGNTAVDAARTAVRLGAKEVRIVYRRTRAEMPAIAEEVEDAIAEGVEICELTTPVRLRCESGRAMLDCRRMVLGEPDDSGRRRPSPLEGEDAQFAMSCDTALLALGQAPDMSVLPRSAEVRGCRVAADLGPALVLICGDFATAAGTVAAAIGSGRAAADRVVTELGGVRLASPDASLLAGPDSVALDRFPKVPQHKGALLPPARRRTTFAEVRRGFTGREGREMIQAEAARCLSCGSCNACETCVAYCPEGVLHCTGLHACEVDYDYCKGCGLCAAQCPRGAIVMGGVGEAVGT
jgi:2-oxoacid:acceptor oxidoreductase gamma subunit (pyruvate/2-ketoisovalerate family)